MNKSGVQGVEPGDDQNSGQDTQEELTENLVTEFNIDDHAWEWTVDCLNEI